MSLIRCSEALLTFGLTIALLAVPCISPVQAGIVSKAASRAALRRVEQRAAIQKAETMAQSRANLIRAARQERNGQISAVERYRHIEKYDKLRDKALPVIHLDKEKIVNRYYKNVGDARRELHNGVTHCRHLTASGANHLGRPISPVTAQSRYGLAYKPKARTTVTLPAGTTVKQGKVIGGKAGYGEILPARRVAPENVSNLQLLP